MALALDGVVAQLVEHHNGIVGVWGSNPHGSTKRKSQGGQLSNGRRMRREGRIARISGGFVASDYGPNGVSRPTSHQKVVSAFSIFPITFSFPITSSK